MRKESREIKEDEMCGWGMAVEWRSPTPHPYLYHNSIREIATNAYISIHQLPSQRDKLLLLLLVLLLLLLLSPLSSPPLLSQTLLSDNFSLLNNLSGLVHALLPVLQSLFKQLPFIRAKATGRGSDGGNGLDADKGLGLGNPGDNEL